VFFKVADAQIQDVISTPRQVSSFLRTAQEQKSEWNLINPIVFNAVADCYKISRNPADYVYIVARAVAADEPNNNGDAFPEEELLRFTLATNSLVYQTFRNDPLHINHWADDPTRAKGFLPDVHYAATDPEDRHVKTLSAACRVKDPVFAEALRQGHINTFSMGAEVEYTTCSICGNTARTEYDFCGHIRDGMKMQKIGSDLCFEKCHGVRFVELSQVGDPAWMAATTDAVLGTGADDEYALPAVGVRGRLIEANPGTYEIDAPMPIQSLGLDLEQMNGAAEYFDRKFDEMPASMHALGKALWKKEKLG